MADERLELPQRTLDLLILKTVPLERAHIDTDISAWRKLSAVVAQVLDGV